MSLTIGLFVLVICVVVNTVMQCRNYQAVAAEHRELQRIAYQTTRALEIWARTWGQPADVVKKRLQMVFDDQDVEISRPRCCLYKPFQREGS